jgi:glycine cleavage system transcriptional repressor
MAILRGEFAMVLVLGAPDGLDRSSLERDLGRVRQELGLEALTLTEVGEEAASPVASAPTHIVSVYGADHPGIVHAIAAVLAERGVNIADLTTRLVDEPGAEALYAMALEISLPAGVEAQELERALSDVARAQGVELSFRALEQDPL